MDYWGTGSLEEKMPVGVCHGLIMAKHQALMKVLCSPYSATVVERRGKKQINEGLMS